MGRSLVTHARGVAVIGVEDGQDVDDAAGVDCEREPLLGDDVGLDAYGPSRTDQGVDCLHRQMERSEKGEQV
jgi:hypothetical protein